MSALGRTLRRVPGLPFTSLAHSPPFGRRGPLGETCLCSTGSDDSIPGLSREERSLGVECSEVLEWGLTAGVHSGFGYPSPAPTKVSLRVFIILLCVC